MSKRKKKLRLYRQVSSLQFPLPSLGKVTSISSTRTFVLVNFAIWNHPKGTPKPSHAGALRSRRGADAGGWRGRSPASGPRASPTGE